MQDNIRIIPILLGPSSGRMRHNLRIILRQGQLYISQLLLDIKSIKRENRFEINFMMNESDSFIIKLASNRFSRLIDLIS